jgi:penicillin amidase
MITNDGHIGYQQLGRYPIRRDPSSGLFVKDGTNTDNDWLGYVPPEHRIQIIDPPKGYIINSNNRIASEQYYDGLHRYTIFTARSDRLHEIISSEIKRGHKFDVSDMKRIVIDTVDSYCLRILPFIIESVPEAERYLKNFDCNFVKESTSAAIY